MTDPIETPTGNEPEFDQDAFIEECNDRVLALRPLLDSSKYSEKKRAVELSKEFEEWLENQYLACDPETRSQVKNLLREMRNERENLEKNLQKPALQSLKETTQDPNPSEQSGSLEEPLAPKPAAPKSTPENTSPTTPETSNETRTAAQERSGDANQAGKITKL